MRRCLASLAFAVLLTAATGALAQTVLDSPLRQWAREELAEAQARDQLSASNRLFARRASDDVHSMVEREGARVRRSLMVIIVVGLIIFFVFELPIFNRNYADTRPHRRLEDDDQAGRQGS